MESILRAVRKREIPAYPAVVISSRADAPALAAARKMGVEAIALDAGTFKGTREEYDMKLVRMLGRHGVKGRDSLVCLAGFMRILGPRFVKRYRNRIINIHPALLPSFPGLGAQRQAIEYGAKLSGCTVHIVDDGVDTGPIILQRAVKIRDDDTPDSLARRILIQEHTIYPMAVELFARGMIKIAGRRVITNRGQP